MPEIGDPRARDNSYSDVRMGARSASNNALKQKDVGRGLNKIAGVKEESRFIKQKDHNKMDKDAFLKLLSNQLANQDPFKPVDQKKFASELAQFSQLEQLANMNSKMDKANGNVPAEQKFMGATLLGKTVLTKGMTLKVTEKTSALNLPFNLDRPASKLMIRIFDSSNNMVQQVEKDGLGMGNQSIIWDLDSLDGTRAVDGDYRFEVRGWDDQYNEFKGETHATGKITGVEFADDGEMLLTVDGKKKVYLRDVDSFGLDLGGVAAKKGPLQEMAQKSYNKVNDGVR